MKDSGPIRELINQGPRIISASAKSPAGVISLMMLIMAVIGYIFFVGATESARIGMFMLMFIGYFTLSVAVLRSSSHLSRERRQPRPAPVTPAGLLMLPRVSLRAAFKGLCLIWGTGSVVLFLLLSTQYLLGKYEERLLLDVWAWLPPAVNTTLFFPFTGGSFNARRKSSSLIHCAAGCTATRYRAGFSVYSGKSVAALSALSTFPNLRLYSERYRSGSASTRETTAFGRSAQPPLVMISLVRPSPIPVHCYHDVPGQEDWRTGNTRRR
jgi:hypothetical protein